MSTDLFEGVPPVPRELARAAVRAALGEQKVTGLAPVPGGASGALTYRVDANGASYLLRIERGMNALQNPYHYACMKSAAEAGVAPRLHHVDPEQGVALMDFVVQRPLDEYAGGAPALVRDMGRLVRRLQDSSAFPRPGISYPDLIDRMFGFVRASRVFAPGVLDAHWEGLQRLRAAYRWDPAALVSSHNDPNPRNILFDGSRLWLVDWETSCRNDPLTDPAVLSHELASTPELQDVLLRSWLGREADPLTRARFVLMRQLSRLYFASVLFRLFTEDSSRTPDADLKALTPAEFVAAIRDGRLRVGTPEVLYEFGKMFLAGFREELAAPGYQEALDRAAG